MKYSDYVRYDALGLAKLVRDRKVSPDELLDVAIERTEHVNPSLNAVVLKHYEYARRQIADGLPDGSFTGVPFLLKDLFIDLAGTTTTSGSVFLKNTVAKADSTVATRYKKAGLVIFGKTHSPELGAAPSAESRLWGVTRNPWNLNLTPAGSSGGTAAAIAAGIVPAGNGSDAGGSIRIPASATGLFGLKPTRGRVPLGPARFDGGGGMATLHALTRSVRDSAALLDAVTGPELGALYGSPAYVRPFVEETQSDPAALRIAVSDLSILGGVAEKECIDAMQDAAELCASLGHQVEFATPTLDVEAFLHYRYVLLASSIAGGIQGMQKALGRRATAEDFEPTTWMHFEKGLQISGYEILAAREAMFTLHKQMAHFMQSYDVLLTPSVQRLPPAPGIFQLTQPTSSPLERSDPYVAYTLLFNMTGQPSMSVPLYWTKENLPVGALFTGRFGEESTLFSLAAQLERARPWFDRLPEIASIE